MRKAVLIVLKAALSALLLYFALDFVKVERVANRLSGISAAWCVVAVAVLLVQSILAALRWRIILQECGGDLPVARVVRFTLIANFFSQVLPSSVGGDAARIWLAGRDKNWRVAAYSVFLDRVVGVEALAILVTLCLPWSLVLVRDPIGRVALLASGLGVLAAGSIFIGLASARLHILQRWIVTRHLAAVAKLGRSILLRAQAMAPLSALSIAVHLLSALVAWCAARATGADLTFLDALILVLPVILIATVPVSIAGWGVRESAMVAAFSYAGLSAADGLLVSLLYGAGALLIGILGGLIWVASSRPAERSMASPSPTE